MTPQKEQTLADEYADGWKPEEGDKIIGTVTDLALGWSDYKNANYPIVTIQPDDSELPPVAIHCFHTALERQMQLLRPTKGERIGIVYKGKRPTKNNPNNEVAVYIVRVEGRTADIWGQPEAQRLAADRSDVPAPVDGDDDLPF